MTISYARAITTRPIGCDGLEENWNWLLLIWVSNECINNRNKSLSMSTIKHSSQRNQVSQYDEKMWSRTISSSVMLRSFYFILYEYTPRYGLPFINCKCRNTFIRSVIPSKQQTHVFPSTCFSTTSHRLLNTSYTNLTSLHMSFNFCMVQFRG
jgi:hypothetical protein